MLNSLKYPLRSFIGVTAMMLSVMAFVFLLVQAITIGTAWHIVSFSIYGLSLMTVWTVSTLYHSLNVSEAANRTLEQLDHAMIYFLIAGTYTPMCLVVLRGGWGWSLFGINWALAITGIVLKLVFRYPPKGIIALLFSFYIIMGWLIVLAWTPLARAMPQGGLFWLVMGGVFYTVGAIVFNIKKLKLSTQFGSHEIWHLFVMAGCFSHCWLMLNYVIQLK